MTEPTPDLYPFDQPDILHPIMGGLLEAVDRRLTADERPVARLHLSPGLTPAWDDCCAGQAYVRVAGMAGQTTPAAVACPAAMVTRLVVGVIRCAHTLDDNGDPPTPEQLTEDTRNTTRDAALVLQALTCDLPNLSNVDRVALGEWTPVGPLGGCVGGEWVVTIQHGLCPCPTIEETP